jgi:hypothetical protein
MDDSRVVIDALGGVCPVQAEGTVDSEPFYFRARGQRWTMSIGGDVLDCADWRSGAPRGEGEYDAGWMSHDEAWEIIHREADLYLRGFFAGTTAPARRRWIQFALFRPFARAWSCAPVRLMTTDLKGF